MATALYPGSFDPVTKGHEDLLRRASALFGKVVVAVAHNPNKHHELFDTPERVALLQQSVAALGLSNVEVTQFTGLTAAYAKHIGAGVLLRGLRVISDFEYECAMHQANRVLDPTLETVFLMPGERYQFVSSRMVREVARFGGDLGAWVAPHVAAALHQRFATSLPTNTTQSPPQ
jgi:pantetheine-phosphate adenylyltransferase